MMDLLTFLLGCVLIGVGSLALYSHHRLRAKRNKIEPLPEGTTSSVLALTARQQLDALMTTVRHLKTLGYEVELHNARRSIPLEFNTLWIEIARQEKL